VLLFSLYSNSLSRVIDDMEALSLSPSPDTSMTSTNPIASRIETQHGTRKRVCRRVAFDSLMRRNLEFSSLGFSRYLFKFFSRTTSFAAAGSRWQGMTSARPRNGPMIRLSMPRATRLWVNTSATERIPDMRGLLGVRCLHSHNRPNSRQIANIRAR
jgi:hypothetical protein